MGIRAHVQVVQPQYGQTQFSGYGEEAVLSFLAERKISVFAGDEGPGNSNRWEIEITENLAEIVRELRANHAAFDKFMPQGEKNSYAEEFAALLEEGLEAAKKNGYCYINVDWH